MLHGALYQGCAKRVGRGRNASEAESACARHIGQGAKDLLDTFKRGTSSRKGAQTLCEGNELLDSELDETYIANLEHLLLCLDK